MSSFIGTTVTRIGETCRAITRWVGKNVSIRDEAPHPADPNLCPLCFRVIDRTAVLYQFCPLCGEIRQLHGDATDEEIRRHCDGGRDFHDQPLLAHAGCRRLNPLYVQNGLKTLEQESRLRWVDAERDLTRVVDHWSLPKILDAAAKLRIVAPEERAMWFPATLLLSIRSGRARRIFVKGSKSVGKSVLSAVAVSGQAFRGTGDVDVENYAYATPSGDLTQPFTFYASVLQSLRDLRTYQPLAMGATDQRVTSIVRAGFYTRRSAPEEEWTLILYDIAGENLEQAPGANVAEHIRSSDLMYAFLDITQLAIFRDFLRQKPADHAEQASRGFSTFIDGLTATSRIRKLIVVTKLDLVDLETARGKAGLSEKQREAIGQLEKLAEQLRAARQYLGTSLPDLAGLARTSQETLAALLDPTDPVEGDIAGKLNRADGTFFVWTEGLLPAKSSLLGPAQESSAGGAGDGGTTGTTVAEPYVLARPVNPFGVAELVDYTLMQRID